MESEYGLKSFSSIESCMTKQQASQLSGSFTRRRTRIRHLRLDYQQRAKVTVEPSPTPQESSIEVPVIIVDNLPSALEASCASSSQEIASGIAIEQETHIFREKEKVTKPDREAGMVLGLLTSPSVGEDLQK